MDGCVDRRFEKMLYAWELNMLSDEDRLAFQEHVLECPSCMKKLREFQEASQLLRRDPEVRVLLEALADREARDERRPAFSEGAPAGRRRANVIKSVVAIAAVLAILVLRPWDITISPSKEAVAAANRLVVLYFDDLSDSLHTGRTGEAIASLVTTDLSESQYVQVVSSQRLYDILDRLGKLDQRAVDRETASRVATAADARWMLTGSIVRDSNHTVIASQLVDVSSGEVSAAQKIAGEPGESIFDLVDRLTVAVKKDLALPMEALRERDPQVASVTTRSPDAYYAYLEGVDYLAKMYTQEATASFERALQYDSTFAMAYYQLARTKDRRLIATAAKYANGASSREQYYIRSRMAAYDGNAEESDRELRGLLKRYPKETEAMYLLSLQAYLEGMYGEAADILYRALEIDPMYKEALNQLCYTEDARGRFESALAAINRYIAIAPNEANPYDTRADLLAGNGRIDQAIDSYRKALEKKPDFTASRLKLGYMYVFKGDYDPARIEFEALLNTSAEADRTAAKLGLAYIDVRRGRFGDALGALDRAIREGRDSVGTNGYDEDRAVYHFVEAQIYTELGQHSEAIGQLLAAADITGRAAPAGVPSYLCLQARELASMGDVEWADSVMDDVTKMVDGLNPSPVSYKNYGRGLVALSRGDAQGAVRLMEKVIRSSASANPFGWRFNLDLAYVRAGMADSAIGDLEGMLQNYDVGRLNEGVSNVRMHYLLGLAYEQVGRADDAAEQYDTFLTIWKDSDHESDEMKDARARLSRLRNRS